MDNTNLKNVDTNSGGAVDVLTYNYDEVKQFLMNLDVKESPYFSEMDAEQMDLLKACMDIGFDLLMGGTDRINAIKDKYLKHYTGGDIPESDLVYVILGVGGGIAVDMADTLNGEGVSLSNDQVYMLETLFDVGLSVITDDMVSFNIGITRCFAYLNGVIEKLEGLHNCQTEVRHENISRIKYVLLTDKTHGDILYEVTDINFYTNEVKLVQSDKAVTDVPAEELFMMEELRDFAVRIQN